MTSIREASQKFEGTSLKNVAELAEVSVDADIKTETRKDRDGEEYKVNVLHTKEGDYRVPDAVLAQLKGIMEKKPNLKKFSVAKSGEGLKTSYVVIPMD